MRHLAQLTVATATFAVLFGCSDPVYTATADLGAVELDLANGPHVVDIHLEITLQDYEDVVGCMDVTPSVRLDWAGDDGDIQMHIATTDDVWEERAVAEDGHQLTTIEGTFRRCTLDATAIVNSPEDLAGTLTATANTLSDYDVIPLLEGDIRVELLDAD